MISVTAFKKLDLKQFVKTRGMVASKNSIYRENVVDFQTFRSEIPPVIPNSNCFNISEKGLLVLVLLYTIIIFYKNITDRLLDVSDY